jgi:hypothetical protein
MNIGFAQLNMELQCQQEAIDSWKGFCERHAGPVTEPETPEVYYGKHAMHACRLESARILQAIHTLPEFN